MSPVLVEVLRFSAAWALIGVVSGWLVVQVPRRHLDHDNWLTRIRAVEEGGRRYERWLRIQRWKHLLPEAGDLFPGGRSKRSTGGRSSGSLEDFVVETRRAEWVHWAQIAAAPTFGLWNPWTIGAAMVAFALVAHLPFIVVQRYNRSRLLRVLERRGRAPAGAAASAAAPTPAGVEVAPT